MPKIKADKKPSGAFLHIGNTHHVGMRENQQDSFAISDLSNSVLCRDKGVFAVVADGMGGMADGSEISSIITQTMLKYFSEATPAGRPELELLCMLTAANENVKSFISEGDKGGSTAAAVIIKDNNLYFISVGDSRIYLIRKGASIQLNREHVYAVDLEEQAAAGAISWEDAENDPGRAALTSYLGLQRLEKIDRNTRPCKLVSGDIILLMSDGVFGVLSDDEILDSVSGRPYKIAERLEKKILKKQNPNQDNFTAIIFEYK